MGNTKKFQFKMKIICSVGENQWHESSLVCLCYNNKSG